MSNLGAIIPFSSGVPISLVPLVSNSSTTIQSIGFGNFSLIPDFNNPSLINVTESPSMAFSSARSGFIESISSTFTITSSNLVSAITINLAIYRNSSDTQLYIPIDGN